MNSDLHLLGGFYSGEEAPSCVLMSLSICILQDSTAAYQSSGGSFCGINTMTNHQVALLLIDFNWCVIYAAVRPRFALLSINKPHGKSQRALKRNANKQCGTARLALLLYA